MKAWKGMGPCLRMSPASWSAKEEFKGMGILLEEGKGGEIDGLLSEFRLEK